MGKKHHNPEWLEKKYWDDDLDQSEIAEICGVTPSTISRLMNDLDVPTSFYEYVNRKELKELYYDKMYSLRDIGEKYSVGGETVRTAFDYHDVETRNRLEYQKYQHPRMYTDVHGYEVVIEGSYGKNDNLKIHRLIAVMEHGSDKVKDMHVHHKNNNSWDNRVENLELMTPKEHSEHHAETNHFWEHSPR